MNSATAQLTIFMECIAQISHDLRNHLAVINERAGLLEDNLTFTQGDELRGEVSKTTAHIQRRIRSTNELITEMNRLAHSIDKEQTQLTPMKIWGHALNLSQRRISGAQLRIKYDADSTGEYRCSSAALSALFLQIIALLCQQLPAHSQLSSSWQQHDNSLILDFTGIVELENDPRLSIIMDSLGAHFSWQQQQLKITLP